MRMKKRYLSTLIAVLSLIAGVDAAAQNAAPKKAKSLVVFFSRVGTSHPFKNVDAVSSASLPQVNTIVIANMVRSAVGGDAFQIVTEEPYPAVYRETTDKALAE